MFPILLQNDPTPAPAIPPAPAGLWNSWRTAFLETFDAASAHPVALLLLSILAMSVGLAMRAVRVAANSDVAHAIRVPVDPAPPAAAIAHVTRTLLAALFHLYERDLHLPYVRRAFNRLPRVARHIASSLFVVTVVARVITLHVVCIAVAHTIA